MKKLFFLLIFLFSFNFSFSQNYTEKWNSYKNQYEYYDSNGNMIAYKTYNSYKEQWETYYTNSNNNGYKIQEPQESVNEKLVKEALKARQERYDLNLLRLKNKIKKIYSNIDYIVLEFDRDDVPTEMDYKYAGYLKNLFQNQHVKIVEQIGYDYSKNSVTDDVISYLENGSIQIITKEFEFYKEVSNDYYYMKVNKYKSLF